MKKKERTILLFVTSLLMLVVLIGTMVRVFMERADESMVSYVTGVIGSAWISCITFYFSGKDSDED